MSVVEKPMRQMRGRLKSALAKRRGAARFPGESPRLLRHKMQALRKRARRWREEGESLAAAAAAGMPVMPETAPEAASAAMADSVFAEAGSSSPGAEVETAHLALRQALADPSSVGDPASSGGEIAEETLQPRQVANHDSAAVVIAGAVLPQAPIATETDEEITAPELQDDSDGQGIAVVLTGETPIIAAEILPASEVVSIAGDVNSVAEAQPSQEVEPTFAPVFERGSLLAEVASPNEEISGSEQALPPPDAEGESAAASIGAVAASGNAPATEASSTSNDAVTQIPPSGEAEAANDVAFPDAEQELPPVAEVVPIEEITSPEPEQDLGGEDIGASVSGAAPAAATRIAPAAEALEASGHAQDVPQVWPSAQVESPDAAALPDAEQTIPADTAPAEDVTSLETESGHDIESADIAASATVDAPIVATGIVRAAEALDAPCDAEAVPQMQSSAQVELPDAVALADAERTIPVDTAPAEDMTLLETEPGHDIGGADIAASATVEVLPTATRIAPAAEVMEASGDAEAISQVQSPEYAELPDAAVLPDAGEGIYAMQETAPARNTIFAEALRERDAGDEDIAASAIAETPVAAAAPSEEAVGAGDVGVVREMPPSWDVEAPSALDVPDVEEGVRAVQEIAPAEDMVSAELERGREAEDIPASIVDDAAITAAGIAPAEEVPGAASGEADHVPDTPPVWAAPSSSAVPGAGEQGDSAAVAGIAATEEISAPAQASPWRAADHGDMALLSAATAVSSTPWASSAGAALAADAAAMPAEAPPAALTPAGRGRMGDVLRAAGIVLLFFLALPYFLIPFYRFIDPPFSAVMAQQLLTGAVPHRRWVDLKDISPALPQAVVIAEDGAFCRHWGVDWRAVGHVLDDVENGDGFKRGASTIPMQTAKNLFLWNGFGFLRKPLEMPLAYYMSIVWPKRRVMEVYLNIVEWGPGIFGAEAAARHHFGKPASQLTSREAALLAAALPNPIRRKAGRPNGKTARIAAHIQARVSREGQHASCVLSR